MINKKILFGILTSSALTLGIFVPSFFKKVNVEDPGDDPIVYNKDSSVVKFEEPHLRGTSRAVAEEDEEDESIGPVSTVKLHYVNDDNKCASRAFYIWANGIDGVEYSDEHNGTDIVEYAADGSSMTLTININKSNPDPRFKEFVGLPSIFYIIKYKMISESNLNWGGQSDDVELVFAEFPPVNEVVEVWSTPAAGGGMAQFATEEETKVDGIKLAKFSDWRTIRCTATEGTKTVKWDLYAFDENYYRIKLKKREAIKKNFLVLSGTNKLTDTNKEFNIEFPYTAKINMVYSLVSKEVSSTSDLAKTVFVGCDALYDTAKFNKYYCYDGDDLGMTYTKDFTTFKVWSPVSANMTLLIYDKDNDTPVVYGGKSDSYNRGWHMSYNEGGIWELTVLGDLKGYYYNFQVDNLNGTTTTVDPYVTAVGCSGVRGLVYDKKDTNPEGWDDLPLEWDGKPGYDIKSPQELAIYEVHVRDFTGDSSWVSNNNIKNGTYKAMVEPGTRLPDHPTVTTGYDHLNELGVNAVQLMPIFDADNDESPRGINKYNWGYNPQNYNAVEGSYSSDPHDGLARIRELKELVLGMSKTDAHTRVTMDVVYNHVSSVSSNPFNKLMPRYYFRYDENGELYDGSGCHNEVKSEAKMCSKFIVDSVYMWAKEYKIKGFRFDLMGLLDYKTMNAVKEKLSTLDKDIYVYGEGWTSVAGYNGSWNGTGSTSTYQVYKYCNNFDPETGVDDTDKCYLGCFNDTGRNGVKGENGAWGTEEVYPQTGFMQKSGSEFNDEPNRVADMVWGIHRNQSNYAKQTVNYISCHDNWTIVDHFYQTMHEHTDNHHAAGIVDIIHASLASHALVFASNGVAFMLGGEEIFRTKEVSQSMIDNKDVLPATYTKLYDRYVSHNSYNSPIEVNSFKWGNKVSVTLGGQTAVDNDGTENSLHYNDAWKSLVRIHKDSNIHFDAPSRKGEIWPSGTTSAGSSYVNLCWTNGSALGIQLDEMFIYVAGRHGGSLGYDFNVEDHKLFSYGASANAGTINFRSEGFGVFVTRRTA
ncbi:MAG: hypothetical protein IKP50_05135 [Bacilli bacterium]|nr:hypothetical protein [Bacilli bacterium]